jgi:hypothetical protein
MLKYCIVRLTMGHPCFVWLPAYAAHKLQLLDGRFLKWLLVIGKHSLVLKK